MDEENDFDSSMYEEDNMEVHLSNDDEPVRKKRRHHSLQLDLDQDDEESIMSLDDFDHKKEEEEESTPITKKIKLKKSSIIPNPAVKILDSFVTPTKSHSTIQTINHKHWHVPIPPIDSPKNLINIKSKQDEDAMVIDEDDLPVLDSETKKQKKAATKITMTKLIDYNPESKKPSADSSVPGSTSIMDPRLLDEKYRHIADNLGKQLDEVASKQLMAVKNTVFDVNSQATEFLKNLIHIYDVIAKARIIQILNDDYTPTTTSYDFSLPDLMELSRTQIVSQIRAPIVTLHERVCREEKNCEGHKMFAQYIWQTANNNQSGPQFPERTASFALKEFHTPDITTQIIEKKTQGTNIMEILKDIPRQPCFFCVLYFVNNLAIQLAKNNQQIEEPMIVQPFSMIFGKPGEYAPQAQLTCGQNFNGLIAPILQYSRSNYVPFLHTIDGIDERVLGWAEIDNIIMGPAQGSNPRGDPLFKFVPPPGSR